MDGIVTSPTQIKSAPVSVSIPQPRGMTVALTDQTIHPDDRLINFSQMDLGAKGHIEAEPIPVLPKKVKKPWLHFKLVKEWYLKEHSIGAYIGWGLLALIIGISIASFITQSILFIVDSIKSNHGAQASDTYIPYTSPQHVLGSSEHLGSDDASSSTSPTTPLQQYQVTNLDSLSKVTATAYLVGDVQTGEILFEHNEGLVSPMASVSKLMTGVLALEEMDPNQITIVSRDSYNTFGTEGELILGEKIRLSDLMYPLLMESSNDGAEVIADAYSAGHDAFLEELNKKAAELGMVNTYYDDPSGLSPKNVSSVEDLFKLARYITQKHQLIWDITRVRQYSILKHQWFNQNHQLAYDSFMGGKNGFIDQAKKTGVSLYNVDLTKGGKRQLVLVLLRSDDRDGDIAKLLNFLQKNAYFTPAISTADQFDGASSTSPVK